MPRRMRDFMQGVKVEALQRDTAGIPSQAVGTTQESIPLKQRNARSLALSLLDEVRRHGTLVTDALRTQLERSSIPQEIAARANQMALGTLRNRRALDAFLAQNMKSGLPEKDPRLMDLLRLGTYELLMMERSTDYGTVHGTVDLARKVKGDRIGGFVNAVLRRIATLPPQQVQENLEKLPPSVRFSVPDWLLEELVKTFPERWEAELEQLNAPAPIWLRPNLEKTTPEALADALRQQGIEVETPQQPPGALKVSPRTPPYATLAFAHGTFWPQDATSQAVLRPFLELAKGRWLDACCGQGTKTLYLSSLGPQTLTASDVSPFRLEMLKRRLESMDGIEVQQVRQDLTAPTLARESFDAVLLDAPCTGLGTLRRHPELRWLRVAEDIEENAQRQRRLLEGVAPLVASGGVLVYAVCSFSGREGPDIVGEFLARHSEFEDATLDFHAPDPAKQPLALPGRQISSMLLDGDAFYTAVLRRRS